MGLPPINTRPKIDLSSLPMLEISEPKEAPKKEPSLREGIDLSALNLDKKQAPEGIDLSSLGGYFKQATIPEGPEYQAPPVDPGDESLGATLDRMLAQTTTAIPTAVRGGAELLRKGIVDPLIAPIEGLSPEHGKSLRQTLSKPLLDLEQLAAEKQQGAEELFSKTVKPASSKPITFKSLKDAPVETLHRALNRTIENAPTTIGQLAVTSAAPLLGFGLNAALETGSTAASIDALEAEGVKVNPEYKKTVNTVAGVTKAIPDFFSDRLLLKILGSRAGLLPKFVMTALESFTEGSTEGVQNLIDVVAEQGATLTPEEVKNFGKYLNDTFNLAKINPGAAAAYLGINAPRRLLGKTPAEQALNLMRTEEATIVGGLAGGLYAAPGLLNTGRKRVTGEQLTPEQIAQLPDGTRKALASGQPASQPKIDLSALGLPSGEPRGLLQEGSASRPAEPREFIAGPGESEVVTALRSKPNLIPPDVDAAVMDRTLALKEAGATQEQMINDPILKELDQLSREVYSGRVAPPKSVVRQRMAAEPTIGTGRQVTTQERVIPKRQLEQAAETPVETQVESKKVVEKPVTFKRETQQAKERTSSFEATVQQTPNQTIPDLGKTAQAIVENFADRLYSDISTGKIATTKPGYAEQFANEVYHRGYTSKDDVKKAAYEAQNIVNELKSHSEKTTALNIALAKNYPARPTSKAAPRRMLLVGRGMHGSVKVLFPDDAHADLYALRGRVRRQMSGERIPVSTSYQESYLAKHFNVTPAELFDLSTEYRKQISESVKGLKELSEYTAPAVKKTQAPVEFKEVEQAEKPTVRKPAVPAQKGDGTPTSANFKKAVAIARESFIASKGKPADVQFKEAAAALKAANVHPVIIDEITNPDRFPRPGEPGEKSDATTRRGRYERAVAPSKELQPGLNRITDTASDFNKAKADYEAAKTDLLGILKQRGVEIITADDGVTPKDIRILKGKTNLSPAAQRVIKDAIQEAAQKGGFSAETVGQGFQMSVTPVKAFPGERLQGGTFAEQLKDFLKKHNAVKAAEATFKRAKNASFDALVDDYLAKRVEGKEGSAYRGEGKNNQAEILVRRKLSASDPDIEPYRTQVKALRKKLTQEETQRGADYLTVTKTSGASRVRIAEGKQERVAVPKEPAVVREEQPTYKTKREIPDTIQVDGKERPTRNSNGQLIHSTLKGIENFWKWFSGSRIVDDQGRPLVVYHGTTARKVAVLKKSFEAGSGIFLTDNEDVASTFTTPREYGEPVFEDERGRPIKPGDTVAGYLKIENPFVLPKNDAQRFVDDTTYQVEILREAKAAGNDGVIANDVMEGIGEQFKSTNYVAWSSNQVKSIRNRGAFSPIEPSILKEEQTGYSTKDQNAQFKKQPPYEPNYKKRPDASEKTDKRAKDIVDGLEKGRKQGRVILANAINTQFRNESTADLVGQEIRTSDDVAVLAQVYRKPTIEVMRYVLVKGGKVVHETGVTSRLPSSTAIFPYAETAEGLAWLNELIKSTGADGYYIVHNHPSGNATASPDDVKQTITIAKGAPGFKGHVIVDSNEYTVIDESFRPAKQVRNFGEDALLTPSLDHPVLGTKVDSNEAVADIVKRIQTPKGWATLIGTNKKKVRSVMTVEEGQLADPKKAAAIARRFATQTGSANIYVHTSDQFWNDNLTTLTKGIQEGFIIDAVSEKGNSADEWLAERTSVFGKERVVKQFGKEEPAGKVVGESKAVTTEPSIVREVATPVREGKRNDIDNFKTSDELGTAIRNIVTDYKENPTVGDIKKVKQLKYKLLNTPEGRLATKISRDNLSKIADKGMITVFRGRRRDAGDSDAGWSTNMYDALNFALKHDDGEVIVAKAPLSRVLYYDSSFGMDVLQFNDEGEVIFDDLFSTKPLASVNVSQFSEEYSDLGYSPTEAENFVDKRIGKFKNKDLRPNLKEFFNKNKRIKPSIVREEQPKTKTKLFDYLTAEERAELEASFKESEEAFKNVQARLDFGLFDSKLQKNFILASKAVLKALSRAAKSNFVKFADWSKEMVKLYGQKIGDYLTPLWNAITPTSLNVGDEVFVNGKPIRIKSKLNHHGSNAASNTQGRTPSHAKRIRDIIFEVVADDYADRVKGLNADLANRMRKIADAYKLFDGKIRHAGNLTDLEKRIRDARFEWTKNFLQGDSPTANLEKVYFDEHGNGYTALTQIITDPNGSVPNNLTELERDIVKTYKKILDIAKTLHKRFGLVDSELEDIPNKPRVALTYEAKDAIYTTKEAAPLYQAIVNGLAKANRTQDVKSFKLKAEDVIARRIDGDWEVRSVTDREWQEVDDPQAITRLERAWVRNVLETRGIGLFETFPNYVMLDNRAVPITANNVFDALSALSAETAKISALAREFGPHYRQFLTREQELLRDKGLNTKPITDWLDAYFNRRPTPERFIQSRGSLTGSIKRFGRLVDATIKTAALSASAPLQFPSVLMALHLTDYKPFFKGAADTFRAVVNRKGVAELAAMGAVHREVYNFSIKKGEIFEDMANAIRQTGGRVSYLQQANKFQSYFTAFGMQAFADQLIKQGGKLSRDQVATLVSLDFTADDLKKIRAGEMKKGDSLYSAIVGRSVRYVTGEGLTGGENSRFLRSPMAQLLFPFSRWPVLQMKRFSKEYQIAKKLLRQGDYKTWFNRTARLFGGAVLAGELQFLLGAMLFGTTMKDAWERPDEEMWERLMNDLLAGAILGPFSRLAWIALQSEQTAERIAASATFWGNIAYDVVNMLSDSHEFANQTWWEKGERLLRKRLPAMKYIDGFRQNMAVLGLGKANDLEYRALKNLRRKWLEENDLGTSYDRRGYRESTVQFRKIYERLVEGNQDINEILGEVLKVKEQELLDKAIKEGRETRGIDEQDAIRSLKASLRFRKFFVIDGKDMSETQLAGLKAFMGEGRYAQMAAHDKLIDELIDSLGTTSRARRRR